MSLDSGTMEPEDQQPLEIEPKTQFFSSWGYHDEQGSVAGSFGNGFLFENKKQKQQVVPSLQQFQQDCSFTEQSAESKHPQELRLLPDEPFFCREEAEEQRIQRLGVQPTSLLETLPFRDRKLLQRFAVVCMLERKVKTLLLEPFTELEQRMQQQRQRCFRLQKQQQLQQQLQTHRRRKTRASSCSATSAQLSMRNRSNNSSLGGFVGASQEDSSDEIPVVMRGGGKSRKQSSSRFSCTASTTTAPHFSSASSGNKGDRERGTVQRMGFSGSDVEEEEEEEEEAGEKSGVGTGSVENGEGSRSLSLLLNEEGHSLPSNSDAIVIWLHRNRQQPLGKSSSKAKLKAAAAAAAAAAAQCCLGEGESFDDHSTSGLKSVTAQSSLSPAALRLKQQLLFRTGGWSSAMLRWQLQEVRVKKRRKKAVAQSEDCLSFSASDKNSEVSAASSAHKRIQPTSLHSHTSTTERELSWTASDCAWINPQREDALERHICKGIVEELEKALRSISVPAAAVQALLQLCCVTSPSRSSSGDCLKQVPHIRSTDREVSGVPESTEAPLGPSSFSSTVEETTFLHPARLIYATRSLLRVWRRVQQPSAFVRRESVADLGLSCSAGQNQKSDQHRECFKQVPTLKELLRKVCIAVAASIPLSLSLTPADCLLRFLNSTGTSFTISNQKKTHSDAPLRQIPPSTPPPLLAAAASSLPPPSPQPDVPLSNTAANAVSPTTLLPTAAPSSQSISNFTSPPPTPTMTLTPHTTAPTYPTTTPTTTTTTTTLITTTATTTNTTTSSSSQTLTSTTTTTTTNTTGGTTTTTGGGTTISSDEPCSVHFEDVSQPNAERSLLAAVEQAILQGLSQSLSPSMPHLSHSHNHHHQAHSQLMQKTQQLLFLLLRSSASNQLEYQAQTIQSLQSQPLELRVLQMQKQQQQQQQQKKLSKKQPVISFFPLQNPLLLLESQMRKPGESQVAKKGLHVCESELWTSTCGAGDMPAFSLMNDCCGVSRRIPPLEDSPLEEERKKTKQLSVVDSLASSPGSPFSLSGDRSNSSSNFGSFFGRSVDDGASVLDKKDVMHALLRRDQPVDLLFLSSLLEEVTPVPPFSVFQVFLHLRRTAQKQLLHHHQQQQLQQLAAQKQQAPLQQSQRQFLFMDDSPKQQLEVASVLQQQQQRSWWSTEEDQQLLHAVRTLGVHQRSAGKWMKVAAFLPGRTNNQCRARYLYLVVDSKRHGLFSPLEDVVLQLLVSSFGRGSWAKIAKHLPGRTEMKCRERFEHCLHEEVKSLPWTTSEVNLLRVAAPFFDFDWQQVQGVIAGRPAEECRLRYEAVLQEQQQQQTVLSFLKMCMNELLSCNISLPLQSHKSRERRWLLLHLMRLFSIFIEHGVHFWAPIVAAIGEGCAAIFTRNSIAASMASTTTTTTTAISAIHVENKAATASFIGAPALDGLNRIETETITAGAAPNIWDNDEHYNTPAWLMAQLTVYLNALKKLAQSSSEEARPSLLSTAVEGAAAPTYAPACEAKDQQVSSQLEFDQASSSSNSAKAIINAEMSSAAQQSRPLSAACTVASVMEPSPQQWLNAESALRSSHTDNTVFLSSASQRMQASDNGCMQFMQEKRQCTQLSNNWSFLFSVSCDYMLTNVAKALAVSTGDFVSLATAAESDEHEQLFQSQHSVMMEEVSASKATSSKPKPDSFPLSSAEEQQLDGVFGKLAYHEEPRRHRQERLTEQLSDSRQLENILRNPNEEKRQLFFGAASLKNQILAFRRRLEFPDTSQLHSQTPVFLSRLLQLLKFFSTKKNTGDVTKPPPVSSTASSSSSCFLKNDSSSTEPPEHALADLSARRTSFSSTLLLPAVSDSHSSSTTNDKNRLGIFPAKQSAPFAASVYAERTKCKRMPLRALQQRQLPISLIEAAARVAEEKKQQHQKQQLSDASDQAFLLHASGTSSLLHKENESHVKTACVGRRRRAAEESAAVNTAVAADVATLAAASEKAATPAVVFVSSPFSSAEEENKALAASHTHASRKKVSGSISAKNREKRIRGALLFEKSAAKKLSAAAQVQKFHKVVQLLGASTSAAGAATPSSGTTREKKAAGEYGATTEVDASAGLKDAASNVVPASVEGRVEDVNAEPRERMHLQERENEREKQNCSSEQGAANLHSEQQPVTFNNKIRQRKKIGNVSIRYRQKKVNKYQITEPAAADTFENNKSNDRSALPTSANTLLEKLPDSDTRISSHASQNVPDDCEKESENSSFLTSRGSSSVLLNLRSSCSAAGVVSATSANTTSLSAADANISISSMCHATHCHQECAQQQQHLQLQQLPQERQEQPTSKFKQSVSAHIRQTRTSTRRGQSITIKKTPIAATAAPPTAITATAPGTPVVATAQRTTRSGKGRRSTAEVCSKTVCQRTAEVDTSEVPCSTHQVDARANSDAFLSEESRLVSNIDKSDVEAPVRRLIEREKANFSEEAVVDGLPVKQNEADFSNCWEFTAVGIPLIEGTSNKFFIGKTAWQLVLRALSCRQGTLTTSASQKTVEKDK